MDLLEKKDIEYITIKEICSKAGVNRSTFYLHYESINDLLEETNEYVNKKFMLYFDEEVKDFTLKIKTLDLDSLKLIESKYLTPYLKFIKENKRIFKASLNNPTVMKTSVKFNRLKNNIIIPILDRFGVDEKEKKYIINFYINGIIAIIKEWINEDCNSSLTESEIEDIIIKCVMPSK